MILSKIFIKKIGYRDLAFKINCYNTSVETQLCLGTKISQFLPK